MCEHQITQAKQNFLNKYNPDQTIHTALSKSLGAAARRNDLYCLVSAPSQSTLRIEIQTIWKHYLTLIAAYFITLRQNNAAEPFNWAIPDPQPQPNFNGGFPNDHQFHPPTDQQIANYRALITGLKDAMNKQFARGFRPTGFRISHSQKSISVFLKHLWCMQHVPMPIECPIDFNILKTLPNNGRTVSWTKIDDIESHARMITALNNLAQPMPLARWELLHFNF